MAIFVDLRARAQAAHLSIWRTILGAWRRVAQHCAQAQRSRHDVETLLRLDDRQLHDVGLTRGQVESFVAQRSAFCDGTRLGPSTHRICKTPA
jgi:uncharacterized protein YjiS (DUF1127 family)